MTHPIACRCGAAALQLSGAPVARAYCHCNTCRDFHGAALLSATAWQPENAIVVRGELASYRHPVRDLTRHFCPRCGETVYAVNRPGLHIVPNALVARAAGGTLPAALAPTLHLYYQERIIDVRDALPKYLEGWDGALYEEG